MKNEEKERRRKEQEANVARKAAEKSGDMEVDDDVEEMEDLE